ncbi:MAG: type II secretion system protein GspN [Nitrospinae bacterium]|nr:type II secretion system protein GspN [Nitrospinota bacterium]
MSKLKAPQIKVPAWLRPALEKVKSRLSDMPELSRYSGYIFFFIAAFAVFFYVRFPSDILMSVVEKVSTGAPVIIKAKDASLSFPPGVKLYDAAISLPDPGRNVEILSARSVTARPSILSALMLKKGISISASTLDGWIYFAGSGFGKDGSKLTLELDGVNPALMSIWKEEGWGKVRGRVDGYGEISLPAAGLIKGDGSFKATLSSGSLMLSKVLVGPLGETPIDSGIVDIVLKSGKAVFNRCEFKGPMFDFSVEGEIIPAPDPRFSRLALKAHIRLTGQLGEKLSPLLSFFPKGPDGATIVKINGTIATPSFG